MYLYKLILEGGKKYVHLFYSECFCLWVGLSICACVCMCMCVHPIQRCRKSSLQFNYVLTGTVLITTQTHTHMDSVTVVLQEPLQHWHK